MLAVLLPTVMMTGIGIILLVIGEPSFTTAILGVLVLGLTGSGITGYILVTIFVGKGASLARVQNDFVSSVSHELRTPLTSIRLLIESLRDGRLADSDRVEVLGLLGRETERLEALVGKVLELSRLESGGHVYSRDRVDVSSLIEESIAAFDAVTLTRPTKISSTIEPGLLTTGDRSTLVRAVLNLLTNAWKYTGDDKQITIRAQGAGRWIEIIVADNGRGIERTEQRAIYEQFNRGRAAYDTGAPGVGLGLAFVRAIIRGHKGKLILTSRPGHTEFRIRLKRRVELEPVAAIAERATS
ncbi:MAG: integral rane sensor signal transduction histidine kinase [Myxococcales bacterium]|nr:integral rane sensor signal transduction histidine kinase [Myxococcales bacterium]